MKTKFPDAEDTKGTQRTQKDIHLDARFSFAPSAYPLRSLRPVVCFLGVLA